MYDYALGNVLLLEAVGVDERVKTVGADISFTIVIIPAGDETGYVADQGIVEFSVGRNE
jgi:hypothetical protein